MGAFGAALVAKENYQYNKIETTMMSLKDAISLTYKTHFSHCKGCSNNCILTINTFSNHKSFILTIKVLFLVIVAKDLLIIQNVRSTHQICISGNINVYLIMSH